MTVIVKLFNSRDHTVIWGDAVEALSTAVPDHSIDLIFADPPYNIGKDFNGRPDKWDSQESYLKWCYQ